MQNKQSIEEYISRIFDSRTRKYFYEAFGCYTLGNYRSSVVMLWSVAICDLFFKLQNLAEQHEDKKAEKILEDINRLHKNAEFPAAWERKFLEWIKIKTELLDETEYNNLRYLRKIRNFAAHPEIKTDLELFDLNKSGLYSITKEATHLLMHDTLEGLLTKMPLSSKKTFNILVEDLEEISNTPPDSKLLKPYLYENYYNRFTVEVKQSVFRSLWKCLFYLKNNRCEKNRDINFRAFLLLFDMNPSMFEKQIKKDEIFFNQVAKEGSPVVYLIRFLARQLEPEIYESLNCQTKQAIKNTIQTNSSARCLAHFVTKDARVHAKELNRWIRKENPNIENDVWNELPSISNSPGWIKKVIRLANTYYSASMDDDTADKRFGAIRILLKKYDEKDLIDLMQKIDRNNQTYDRRRVQTDHEQIVSKMKDINPSFDFKQFQAFASY